MRMTFKANYDCCITFTFLYAIWFAFSEFLSNAFLNHWKRRFSVDKPRHIIIKLNPFRAAIFWLSSSNCTLKYVSVSLKVVTSVMTVSTLKESRKWRRLFFGDILCQCILTASVLYVVKINESVQPQMSGVIKSTKKHDHIPSIASRFRLGFRRKDLDATATWC